MRKSFCARLVLGTLFLGLSLVGNVSALASGGLSDSAGEDQLSDSDPDLDGSGTLEDLGGPKSKPGEAETEVGQEQDAEPVLEADGLSALETGAIAVALFAALLLAVFSVLQLARQGGKSTRGPRVSNTRPPGPTAPKPPLSTFPSGLSQGVVPSDAASDVSEDVKPLEPRMTLTLNANQDIESRSRQIDNRNLVVQPQIGEPSAFAKFLWWNADRDWCQLSERCNARDVICDVGTAGSLALAAVSLRGHKHKVSGRSCQDAFAIRLATSINGDVYLIAVVCDGLSSATYSHYGAQRASELLSVGLKGLIESSESISYEGLRSSIPTLLGDCKDNLIPVDSASHGAIGISDEAINEVDLYTTLTFAIVPAGNSQVVRRALVGGIGDSPIFLLSSGSSEWNSITIDHSQANVVDSGTQAFPVSTSPDFKEFDLEEGDVLTVMSDGVGNFIRVNNKQTLLGSYLANQWRRPVSLPTFINDASFDLKSADDDRTVVSIWVGRH